MALPSLDQLARDPAQPAEQELRPLRCGGSAVQVRVRVRRLEPQLWVGALVFVPAGGAPRATAEILKGATEAQIWESVRGLGAHHLRDLYRSLT